MRRKNTRAASKASPEKVKEEKSPKKARRHSKRHKPTSSESESEDEVSVSRNETSAPPAAELWTVTQTEQSNNDIGKIKICLARPSPATPERTSERASKRLRNKPAVVEDSPTEEKTPTRRTRRSRGGSSPAKKDELLPQEPPPDVGDEKKGKGKSKGKHKSKTVEQAATQHIVEQTEMQGELSENVQVTAQSPQNVDNSDPECVERDLNQFEDDTSALAAQTSEEQVLDQPDTNDNVVDNANHDISNNNVANTDPESQALPVVNEQGDEQSYAENTGNANLDKTSNRTVGTFETSDVSMKEVTHFEENISVNESIAEVITKEEETENVKEKPQTQLTISKVETKVEPDIKTEVLTVKDETVTTKLELVSSKEELKTEEAEPVKVEITSEITTILDPPNDLVKDEETEVEEKCKRENITISVKTTAKVEGEDEKIQIKEPEIVHKEEKESSPEINQEISPENTRNSADIENIPESVETLRAKDEMEPFEESPEEETEESKLSKSSVEEKEEKMDEKDLGKNSEETETKQTLDTPELSMEKSSKEESSNKDEYKTEKIDKVLETPKEMETAKVSNSAKESETTNGSKTLREVESTDVEMSEPPPKTVRIKRKFEDVPKDEEIPIPEKESTPLKEIKKSENEIKKAIQIKRKFEQVPKGEELISPTQKEFAPLNESLKPGSIEKPIRIRRKFEDSSKEEETSNIKQQETTSPKELTESQEKIQPQTKTEDIKRSSPLVWGETTSIPNILLISSNRLLEIYPNLSLLDESSVKLEATPRERARELTSQLSHDSNTPSTPAVKRRISKDEALSNDVQKSKLGREESSSTTSDSNSIALHRKISIVEDEASSLRPPPSPAKHEKSSVLFITNLVRPFTVKQLRGLLERTGKIVEDGFWTDKIKSKCYVQYETEDEAEMTRNAIHNVTWPIGNGKKLIIDFSTVEELETARNPPVVILPPAPANVESEKTNHESPKKPPVAARDEENQQEPSQQWSEKELQLSRGRSSSVEHKRRLSTNKRSPSPEIKKKRREEPVPQRAMDDLFRKTEATPSVYWLPLMPEEIVIKQQQRLERMEAHKRKLEMQSRSRRKSDRQQRGGGHYRRRY